MTNQDLESCKRDIEIIKSTIEKSKVNLGSLALLFMVYGATVVLSNLICPPVTMYLDLLQSVYPWIRYMLLGILFIFYCIIYQKNKTTTNTYTTQLMRIWGTTMFYFPLLTMFKNLAMVILEKDILSDLQPIILVVVHLMEVFAFIIALLFTGVIFSNKPMIVLSLLAAPIIPLILMGGASGGIPMNDGVYISTLLARKTRICYDMVSVGYILLGVYF